MWLVILIDKILFSFFLLHVCTCVCTYEEIGTLIIFEKFQNQDLKCFFLSFHPRFTKHTANIFIRGFTTKLLRDSLFVIILIRLFSNHWLKDAKMKYNVKLIKRWKYEKIRPKRQILRSSIENFFPEILPKIPFNTLIKSIKSNKMVQL